MKTFRPTITQQFIWLDQEIFKSSAKYNIGGYVSLKGVLEVTLLSQAIQGVLNAQKVYSTVFSDTDQELLCICRDSPLDLNVDIIDLSRESSPIEMAMKWMEDDFQVPFSLKEGELFAVKLLRISAEHHFWYTKIHHIISDGWSFMLLLNQVRDTYNALLANESVEYEQYSYREYALDEADYQRSEMFLEDRRFWMNEFPTLPPELFRKIPVVDEERSPVGSITLHVPRDVQKRLQEFAAAKRVSFFQLFLALLGTYLSRTQQQDTICMAFPVLNRPKKRFKSIAGVFMNLICMSLKFTPEEKLMDIIGRIGKKLYAALKHQRYQYGNLLTDLNVSVRNRPLYYVKISYEDFDFSANLGDTKVETVALTNHTETDPLSIYIRDYNNNGLDIRFIYQKGYISFEAITALREGLLLLMENIEENYNSALSGILLVNDRHTEKILSLSRGPGRIWAHHTFAEKWIQSLKNNPQNIAVCTDTQQFTYFQLQEQVLKLSFTLKEICRGDSMIALLLPRSEAMVTGMIACILSGITYVPIDPEEPEERLYSMLTALGCKVLITSRKLCADTRGIKTTYLEDVLSSQLPVDPGPLLHPVDPDSVCYVLHTSGSTGIPKPVAITHKAMCNYIDHFQHYFKLTQNDYVIQQSSISFDTSVEEIFPILATGGRLYILEDRKNINLLREIVESEGITILSTTPLVLNYLNTSIRKGSLRLVIGGGDVLYSRQISSFLDQDIAVYNTYGPTETTVCVSYHPVAVRDQEVVPIGGPISNVSVYVLDQQFYLQPVGVEGEICIGGVSLAVNGTNGKQPSEDRVIKSLFHEGVLYRTGDVGKWSNGVLHFIERKDDQVKIRGIRVALKEIEQIFMKHVSVRSAAVIANKNDVDVSLAAFVVLHNGAKPEQGSLREFVRRYLPDYMVPGDIVEVAEMPVAERGKVDVKWLQSALSAIKKPGDEPMVKPESKYELLLYHIWTTIFNRKDISITDNFFLIGGHSLTANMVVNKIQEESSIRIMLGDVFNYPTIQDMGRLLTKYEQENYDTIEIG